MARHWQTVAALWLAGAAPWTLGAYAVYIVSAQYTGLGLVESYQGFQVGSNVGNVLWFVLWTGISALTCWFLSRRTSRPTTLPKMIASVLLCYAVPALLVFLPDAAMGSRFPMCGHLPMPRRRIQALWTHFSSAAALPFCAPLPAPWVKQCTDANAGRGTHP
jgi:hypothetical protein